MLNAFCLSPDYNTITNGFKLFFSMVSHIVQYKKEIDLNSSCALIILIDMFPSYMHGLEYGRIEKSFPPAIVTEAYRYIKESKNQGRRRLTKSELKELRKKREQLEKNKKKLQAAVKTRAAKK